MGTVIVYNITSLSTSPPFSPMFYPLLRQALFQLEPETAHDVALRALRLTGPALALFPPKGKPRQVMGLSFPNPVGLAAGLDKNAEFVDGLGALGFGFIEVGTVTPRPQPGNPRPRLFRLPEAHALINRMGFNNGGVVALCERVRQRRYRGILGINIGKNRDTAVADAANDYVKALEQVYPLADYVSVNVSSPNTPGLRDLQLADALARLLESLAEARLRLVREQGRYVPMVVKLAPDLAPEDLAASVATLLRFELDGVIATNTTAGRPGVTGLAHADEAGGLSGNPLKSLSLAVLQQLVELLAGKLPVISVGGIDSLDDARERLALGASLVQVYTGLIYQGPRLVRELVRGLG